MDHGPDRPAAPVPHHELDLAETRRQREGTLEGKPGLLRGGAPGKPDREALHGRGLARLGLHVLDLQHDLQPRDRRPVGRPCERQVLGADLGSDGDPDLSVLGRRQGQRGEPERDLADRRGRSEGVPESVVQHPGLEVGTQAGVRRVVVAPPGLNHHVGAVHPDTDLPQPTVPLLAGGMVAEEVMVRGLPGEAIQGLGQVGPSSNGRAAGDRGQDLRPRRLPLSTRRRAVGGGPRPRAVGPTSGGRPTDIQEVEDGVGPLRSGDHVVCQAVFRLVAEALGHENDGLAGAGPGENLENGGQGAQQVAPTNVSPLEHRASQRPREGGERGSPARHRDRTDETFPRRDEDHLIAGSRVPGDELLRDLFRPRDAGGPEVQVVEDDHEGAGWGGVRAEGVGAHAWRPGRRRLRSRRPGEVHLLEAHDGLALALLLEAKRLRREPRHRGVPGVGHDDLHVHEPDLGRDGVRRGSRQGRHQDSRGGARRRLGHGLPLPDPEDRHQGDRPETGGERHRGEKERSAGRCRHGAGPQLKDARSPQDARSA